MELELLMRKIGVANGREKDNGLLPLSAHPFHTKRELSPRLKNNGPAAMQNEGFRVNERFGYRANKCK